MIQDAPRSYSAFTLWCEGRYTVGDVRGERQRLGDDAAETGMAAVIEGTTVTNEMGAHNLKVGSKVVLKGWG